MVGMNTRQPLPLRVEDLGRLSYDDGLDAQKRRLAACQNDPDGPDTLLLVEHDPPVITLGRRADARHVLAAEDRLAAAGVQLRRTRRGGDVTVHLPGQLVAYPIINLRRRDGDLHRYFRQLEAVVMATLARFGLVGHRVPKRTGVWVHSRRDDPGAATPSEERKIAAMGVAVSRWVTWHGLALNVCCDLDLFGLIVPCGIDDRGVTSLSAELGRTVHVRQVKPILAEQFAEAFGCEVLATRAGEPTTASERPQ